eukprot:3858828-Prymnesium_polylepis.1
MARCRLREPKADPAGRLRAQPDVQRRANHLVEDGEVHRRIQNEARPAVAIRLAIGRRGSAAQHSQQQNSAAHRCRWTSGRGTSGRRRGSRPLCATGKGLDFSPPPAG